jgi:DAK2 domain fusion protein YloV
VTPSDDRSQPRSKAQEEEGGGLALPPLLRFSDLVVEALHAAREEIDGLNVYPVPDGDTGTNLFLTFDAAHQALQASVAEQGGEEAADLPTSIAAYARGLLLGARGNSGVIMSQLVGALFRRIAAASPGERAAAVFAAGMEEATRASYEAVAEPVEGTILTVARAATDAAVRAVQDPEVRSADVMAASRRAAEEALARTPEQLEVLRRAGVVDAGGRGLCVVLDCAEAAYTGRHELVSRIEERARRSVPVMPLAEAGADLSEEGPAYEVMYLLDAADDAVPELREKLAPLGDSLVVVGGEGLWNVHVHVDDVGAAVEAGIEAGRPYRIRVTHFAEQVAASAARNRERTGRGVVAVAAGPGLAQVFTDAGAEVVQWRPDARPSTGELVAAITATGAGEVVVLPNDRDVVPTAEAAARLATEELGLRVAVIPTRTQVQGMAGLAVHEPGRDFDQDLVEMSAAARHARSGAVTVAVRRAITTAGACEPGDVLGAVEGDFAVIGAQPEGVAREVLDRLLGGGGELVTVIAGRDSDGLAEACAVYLAAAYPSVDVLVYDGGQDRYPVLFGVE